MQVAAIYGVSVIVVSSLFLALYIPIIIEFRKSPAYIIMTHIAITDVAQLLIHFYSGILVLLQAQPIYWLDKFLGAVLTGLWFCMLIFTLFLNYNRLATIILARYKCINTMILYGICYLSFIIPFVMKLFPENSYLFNVKEMYWSPPKTDGTISHVQQDVSKYLILVVVISSLITYSLIFFYIGVVSNTKLTKRELRITIQISLVVTYFLFSFFYWNYLPSIISMVGIYWEYQSMMVWVVMNGIHAIIYLIFNERLRSSFMFMMKKGKIPVSTNSQMIHVTKVIPMYPTRTISNSK